LARRADLTPERTRALLIQAAGDLFADAGFHGVSLREIGERAGVQSAMIAYYYKDKAGLHEAVIHAYYDRLAEIREAVIPQMPMDLDALAGVIWREVYPRRNAVRLITRYILDHGHLPPVARLQEMTSEARGFAAALGGDAMKLELGLTSFLYLLSRWTMNNEAELQRLTHTESLEAAHDVVAAHLASCAKAFLR
jgi:AcrR family transcriptional regulator